MTKNNVGRDLKLSDHGFAKLLNNLELTCLDVGARGGFLQDLLPIAPAVRAIGFEPDAKECERLNSADAPNKVWRSLRFLPEALGKATETRTLNIYRKRGCSSLYEADSRLAERFQRDDYYLLDDTVEVATTTADEASITYGFEDAAFLKLDVQGAELEILSGSQNLLRNSLVGLRMEVSFMPIYLNQPLFADIDQALRRYDFFPARFLELHPWRRFSRVKLPNLDNSPYPYSEGQIIHGDVLYLRWPESLPDQGEAEVERLIRAAIIALAYGMIDHGRAIFQRPAVKAMVLSRYGIDPLASTSSVSRFLARRSGSSFGLRVGKRLRSFLREWA